VLGLGRMGAPIARALAERWEVVAYDPAVSPEGSAEEVAAAVDVLVTVLPGAAEVRGLGAVLGVLRPGSLWLDLTSGDPRVTRELAHPGIEVVGAPMAGGPSAAEARTLAFFVGGAPGAVDRARPLLDALGTHEVIGNDVGDGYTAKLLANLLWFGQVVAVAEAMLLGQSLGLDPVRLRRTLAASAGGSVFIDEYLDRLLEGDYAETFGLDRVVEELDTLASLAREQGVPFELSSLVARLHGEALERFGAVDGELLAARLLEERAGRELRSESTSRSRSSRGPEDGA
jgi:3-hydroxyisobutyrate dehydrogenase-like beta-hydroxyacid dehydrogenase